MLGFVDYWFNADAIRSKKIYGGLHPASPLAEGERTKVRGSIPLRHQLNPHPPPLPLNGRGDRPRAFQSLAPLQPTTYEDYLRKSEQFLWIGQTTGSRPLIIQLPATLQQGCAFAESIRAAEEHYHQMTRIHGLLLALANNFRLTIRIQNQTLARIARRCRS